MALGGRVAEELVYGDITTGAEEDIRQITELAHNMVARWRMSEAIGPISVAAEPHGGEPFGVAETSPETLQLVDREIRHLVDEAHEAVTALLHDHRDALERLARALIADETLDEQAAHAAAGIAAQLTGQVAG